MQQTAEQIIHTVVSFLEAELPTKLSSQGLDNFVRYSEEPPLNLDDLELAMYLAEGSNSVNFADEAFIIQCQLSGVMNPVFYHTVIWETLLQFSSAKVGFTTKRITYSAFYPGEASDGGSSSYLIYEIGFSSELDDCEIED